MRALSLRTHTGVPSVTGDAWAEHVPIRCLLPFSLPSYLLPCIAVEEFLMFFLMSRAQRDTVYTLECISILVIEMQMYFCCHITHVHRQTHCISICSSASISFDASTNSPLFSLCKLLKKQCCKQNRKFVATLSFNIRVPKFLAFLQLKPWWSSAGDSEQRALQQTSPAGTRLFHYLH